MYDSFFKELDEETVDTINNYFGTENSRCKVKCKMIDVKVQKKSKDCAAFAIAFLTSLAYDLGQNLIVYNQDQLRCHLCDCVTKGKLVPFP